MQYIDKIGKNGFLFQDLHYQALYRKYIPKLIINHDKYLSLNMTGQQYSAIIVEDKLRAAKKLRRPTSISLRRSTSISINIKKVLCEYYFGKYAKILCAIIVNTTINNCINIAKNNK